MRDHCKFCRYGNDQHAENCPRDLPGAEKRYDAGWIDGRQGRQPTDEDDLAYMAGYLRGEIALEQAENGCPW